MNSENKIKHLHWRAGFGLSPAEWQARRSWTVNQAVDNLFDGAAATALVEPALDGDYRPGKMSGKERAEKQKEQRQFVAELGREWIERMASPKSSSLLEKMSFFWHGHFACTSSHGLLAVRQLNLLRTHALGNFRDMVRAIARDPAMIRFLNNQQNKKRTPNENFAREVMELFTIGRRNYTETDVKEAARAFTGWSSNFTGEFVFRQRQHDFEEKTFMGQTGNFDGDDIIDIILEREETAAFICRKIYAYFVNTEVDEGHVGELATTFRKTDYDIAAVMQQLFTSNWFYAPKNVANRIKSPVELLAGMMRQLEVTGLQTKGVVAIQRVLGQLLFHPPNVAGWPGGRNWIDNSTLMTRLNLAAGLMLASDFDLQLPDDLEGAKRQQLKQLKATLDLGPLRSLVASLPPSAVRQPLADYLLSPPDPGHDVVASAAPDLMILRLLSTPEYQLC